MLKENQNRRLGWEMTFFSDEDGWEGEWAPSSLMISKKWITPVIKYKCWTNSPSRQSKGIYSTNVMLLSEHDNAFLNYWTLCVCAMLYNLYLVTLVVSEIRWNKVNQVQYKSDIIICCCHQTVTAFFLYSCFVFKSIWNSPSLFVCV